MPEINKKIIPPPSTGSSKAQEKTSKPAGLFRGLHVTGLSDPLEKTYMPRVRSQRETGSQPEKRISARDASKHDANQGTKVLKPVCPSGVKPLNQRTVSAFKAEHSLREAPNITYIPRGPCQQQSGSKPARSIGSRKASTHKTPQPVVEPNPALPVTKTEERLFNKVTRSAKPLLPTRPAGFKSLDQRTVTASEGKGSLHRVRNGRITKQRKSPKSLLQRKVKKLTHMNRPYTLKVAGKDIRGFNETLDSNDPVILNYMSKGKVENLNGKAINPEGDGNVVCRHLAYAFATGQIGEKEAGKFSTVSTVARIIYNPRILNDRQLREVQFERVHSEGCYFAEKNLGKAIQAMVRKQIKDDCSTKGYIIHTTTHALALKIELTQGDEIRLAFYDPNDTLRVNRTIASSIDALDSLSLRELVADDGRFNQYYSPESEFSTVIFSIEAKPEGKEASVEIIDPVNARMIYHLTESGHLPHPTARKKLKQMLNVKNLADEEAIIKAIYCAIHYKQSESATVLLEAILESSLDEDVKVRLLERKHYISSIELAISRADYQFITYYIQLVANSKLSDSSKKKLLGVSRVINYDLDKFSDEGLKIAGVVVKAILDSNLDEGFKIRLLKPEKHRSILEAGLSEANPKFVENYVQLVAGSKISDISKINLLQVSQTIEYGLDNISTDEGLKITGVVVKAILDSNLDEDVKIRLLKPEKHRSILEAGLSKANPKFVENYIQLVAGSKISDRSKIKLLQASQAIDYGLGNISIDERLKLTGAVVKAILNSNLDEDVKIRLLKPEKQRSILEAGLSEANPKFVENYVQLVAGSKLSKRNKREVLYSDRLKNNEALKQIVNEDRRAPQVITAYGKAIKNSHLDFISKRFLLLKLFLRL
ncbi:ShET2/EspL2 family type III secretion system effector toxin [Candidatus Sororendozoicomonas aggregata]|uniref:ShET2/EspL2 family type III secretion system effector toxin n=1 Tax=Candidatus Sororendozoicomonas aggregata TaxID=3073239 RepID=UPI002ED67407